MLNIVLTSTRMTPSFEDALRSIIEISFSTITSDNIVAMKAKLLKNFNTHKVVYFSVLDFTGLTVTSQIRLNQYTKSIDVYFPKEPAYDDYNEFSFLRDGAKAVVEIVKQLRIRDLALYSFITEGHLMPVGKFDNTRLQFYIHFNNLNSTVFYVDYDKLAFDKFVVVG